MCVLITIRATVLNWRCLLEPAGRHQQRQARYYYDCYSFQYLPSGPYTVGGEADRSLLQKTWNRKTTKQKKEISLLFQSLTITVVQLGRLNENKIKNKSDTDNRIRRADQWCTRLEREADETKYTAMSVIVCLGVETAT